MSRIRLGFFALVFGKLVVSPAVRLQLLGIRTPILLAIQAEGLLLPEAWQPAENIESTSK
jgi:hypothetical protein